MTSQSDNPGVIALPPLIALAAFLAGIALDWLVPIGAVNAMLWPTGRVLVAAILFLMACWIVFRAVRTFDRAGTPYDVRKPAVALAASDIWGFLHKPADKNFWWYAHMGGMVGSYIAAVSAFSVVNFHFLPLTIRWLWPSAIGVPGIFIWIGFYRRKFGRKEKRVEAA